jgi:small multidrug resistance pump
MSAYFILFSAIAFEVLATMLLPASQNFSKMLPTGVLLASYGISFFCLSILVQKLPLPVIYATWSGLGVFSVAILSNIFYKQAINWQTVMGLFLIVVGVIIVNSYKGLLAGQV